MISVGAYVTGGRVGKYLDPSSPCNTVVVFLASEIQGQGRICH